MGINWGIIGSGHMARKFAQTLSSNPDHKAVAIYSRCKNNSELFANDFQISNSSNSIQDFLELKSIDAVYIATPHTTHFEYSWKALSRGKGVLCEKPLYFTSFQFEIIARLSKDNNCLFMESLGFILNPNFQRMLEIIESNEIGEVHSSFAKFCKKMDMSKKNRITDIQLGGGVLNEMGSYPISLAYFLFGMPFFSQVETTRNSLNLDIEVSGLLKFRNNKTVQFICSFNSSDESVAKVSGSKGEISLNHPYYLANSLTLSKSGGFSRDYSEPLATPNNLQFVLDHFRNLFEKGKIESDLISLNDSKMINEILIGLRG